MDEIIRCITRTMKLIGLIGCFSVSLSNWTAAQTNAPLDDPLFGIELDPTQVHFEISPPRIGRACGELRNRVLWIFANTVNEGKNYFILNGYFPTAGSTSKVSESDFGIGVILDGTSCKVMTSEKLMSGDVPSKDGGNTEQTPPAVLDALSVDALNRMVSAFRDRSKFKLALSRAVAAHDAYQTTLPPPLRSDYPPVLRKRVDDFLKEP